MAVENQSEEMLSDEQAAQVEADYLSGKITETSGLVQPDKEETEDEEKIVEEEDKDGGVKDANVKENQRLRQKNREVTEQMEELRSQLEALSSRVAESDTPKTEQTQIQKASTEDLTAAEIQLQQKLYDARQEGNEEAVRQLTTALKSVKTELLERPSQSVLKKQEEAEAKAQWDALEAAVVSAVPDIKNKSSAIYKSAEEWAGKNQALMKLYGAHLGGVLATAQALINSKAKTKSEKQAVKSVAEEMEKIAESSVSKPGSTGTPSNQVQKDYSQIPDEDFEKMYASMLAGNRPIP